MNLLQVAKQYVDLQLETMRRHGSAPDLSEAEYYGLIEDVAMITAKQRLRVENERLYREWADGNVT